MEEKNVVRTVTVTQYRTLADGTRKAYQTKKTYKIKGCGYSGGKDKLTAEQKASVIAKHNSGVTTKRICEDLGVTYGTVKRVIDKKKAALAANGTDQNPQQVQGEK